MIFALSYVQDIPTRRATSRYRSGSTFQQPNLPLYTVSCVITPYDLCTVRVRVVQQPTGLATESSGSSLVRRRTCVSTNSVNRPKIPSLCCRQLPGHGKKSFSNRNESSYETCKFGISELESSKQLKSFMNSSRTIFFRAPALVA